MHDNTLARAMQRTGIDIQLIPTYTPIRTDEEDVSIDRVFLGGVSVYMEQVIPGYRLVAPMLSPLLDQPWLLKLATRRASSTSSRSLGKLTVSMLRGTSGRQRRETEQLCQWLSTSVKPRLVVFSNILIAGCAALLKQKTGARQLVTLQGDDIFLESLPEKYRRQAFEEIAKIVPCIDGFLVHSQFYADFMSDYLRIPADKIRKIPLGVDVADFVDCLDSRSQSSTPTIGYLARLAPEKGLHVLVDAFIALRRQYPNLAARLRVAGYLGENHRGYAEEQFANLKAASLGDQFEYLGSVNRREKIEFLSSLDLLSVPTTYRDPKGLFVLEALAAGVPVVQPAHGAFPELIERLGGGDLVPPNDPAALAEAFARRLTDREGSRRLGNQGREAVLRDFNAEAMAVATWSTWQEFLPKVEKTGRGSNRGNRL
jgi:glycosyltransferase involved in cell wall biosynthesis